MEEVALRQLDIDTVYTFTYTGNLGVEDMQFRLYNDTSNPRVISKVRASVGTAPTGSVVVVNVKKNGTSIFNSGSGGGQGKVTIPAGQNTATSIPKTGTVWGKDEYLTVAIESIGSTFAGADLTINVVVSE